MLVMIGIFSKSEHKNYFIKIFSKDFIIVFGLRCLCIQTVILICYIYVDLENWNFARLPALIKFSD